jgi:hypothetical protein
MHGRAGAGPKRGAAGPQPVRRADRLASVARGCAARRACRSQLCAARRTSAAFGRAKVGRSRCRLSPGPCMAPGGDRPVVQGDLPADHLASVARGCAARRACRSQLCAARRTSAAFGRAKVGRSRCRLSPGPCMAPGGDRPVVQGDLPRADPGGALRSVRPEQPMHGAGCSGRTDRGRRPHPELHIGGPASRP